MKKIGIMTWLHNGNYGTILQAYALQIFLRKNNYDVININYNLSNKNKVLNLLIQHNSLDLFKEKFEFRKFSKRHPEEIKEKNQKFNAFLNNIKHTKLISNNNGLAKISESFDYYICGSDQIWSPRLFNPSFYLNFVKDSKKKISYACSFGSINTSKKKNNKIKKLLSDFKYISVREEKGYEYLLSLNIQSNIDVDPTLLLDYEDWMGLIQKNNTKKDVFAYFLTYNAEYINIVKQFCDKNNYKLNIICNFEVDMLYNMENVNIIYNAGPLDWLDLIANSNNVFTDSYHGLLLSLILKTNVRVFKRFSDGGKNNQNSRIYHILNLLELNDLLVKDTIKEVEIDFDKVSNSIKKYAVQSKKRLLDSVDYLEGVTNNEKNSL